MYIAKTHLRVGRGPEGTVVDLYPGDAVPEAAEWRWHVREQYLKNGHIAEVPDAAPSDDDATAAADTAGARATARRSQAKE